MTALRPRGPLPGRVYWTRRVLVLVVALGLVFGIARLLQGGGPGDPQVDASTVGGSPTAQSTTTATTTASPSVAEPTKAPGQKKADKKKPLPEPQGPCADDDVTVTPLVKKAHVGDPVKVVLEVSTQESRACTWEVSPASVFVTISQEATTLWSSQDCPQVIPTEDVVPRRKTADKVAFTWNGRESDGTCSPATDWVLRGAYRVSAVARGATDPEDSLFVLGGPTPATKTPKPHPTADPTKDAKSDAKSDGKNDGKSKNGNE